MNRKARRIIATWIFLSAFVLGLYNNGYGQTLWCNPANSGKEDGLSKSSGYKSLWKTVRKMQPGDTIIIANGDWRDGGNEMSIRSLGGGRHFPPSGTSLSNMTTIRAETDWQVFLPILEDPGVGREYMRLEGIVFTDFSGINRWHRSKIIRCGFRGQKRVGNVTAFALLYCEGSLVEECIAWGGGRYKFMDYNGKQNIFRRCVARHDWYVTDSNTACQESNFRGYGSRNCAWQNCISIDSDRLEYQTPKGRSYEDGDFWIGDQTGAGGNIVNGCMVIKGMYNAYALGGPDKQGDAETVLLKNSVALGPSLKGVTGLTGAITYAVIRATVENCLFVKFNKDDQHFISHNKYKGSLRLTDSIARDVGKMKDVSANYNCFFNAGPGNYGKHSTRKDPLKSGLLYPCRIEPESLLSRVGSGGGICGPTILKKIGVPGTLYGEPGWDTVTHEKLWPFPNQEKIWELMRETVDGVNGIYGFCANGQTLTNYIWAYFGNTVPPFNVRAISNDEGVSITWDAPAPVALTTTSGFNVYDVTDGKKILIGATVQGTKIYSKTLKGLVNGKAYRFAVTAIDKEKGESGLSYAVSVTSKKEPATEKHLETKPESHGEMPIKDLKETISPKKISHLITPNKRFTNKLGIEFVFVPPGTFTMGVLSDKEEKGDNSFLHQVILTKGFYMQTTETTQEQWRELMGNNPSFFKECGDDCPVEQVSWNEVQQFIKRLNQAERTNKYRLPTEAEWEYACRAGTKTPFSFGACLSTIQANYCGDYPFFGCEKGVYREKPVSVKSFPPNPWGLIGMHGNVWEWCQDRFGQYPSGNVTDPLGPSSGKVRVYRGGGWNSYAKACRSGNRSGNEQTKRFANLGFRLVRDI